MWWLFPTVVTGGVGEILGWVGRLWGSREPTSMNPYLMQFVLLCSPFVTHSKRILPYIQDYDNDHQSYVHPRRQLRNDHTNHPEARATVQSPEAPFV